MAFGKKGGDFQNFDGMIRVVLNRLKWFAKMFWDDASAAGGIKNESRGKMEKDYEGSAGDMVASLLAEELGRGKVPKELSQVTERMLASGVPSEKKAVVLGTWTRMALPKLLKTRPWLSSLEKSGKGFVLTHSDKGDGVRITGEDAFWVSLPSSLPKFGERVSFLLGRETESAREMVERITLPKFVSDRSRLIPFIVGLYGREPERHEVFEAWLSDALSSLPSDAGFEASSKRGEMSVRISTHVDLPCGSTKIWTWMTPERLSKELLDSEEETLVSALSSLSSRFAVEVFARAEATMKASALSRRKEFEHASVGKSVRELVLSAMSERVMANPSILSDDERFSNVLVACLQEAEEEDKRSMALMACGKELPSSLPEFYPLARGLNRKVVMVLGPTNSGKTWRALERLKTASSGCYLGPLRLLALEVRDRLVDDGVRCSLVTGESVEIDEAAKYVSSTIEMANFTEEVEVAIVDESQMFSDTDRGSAWVEAIVGIPAKEVWLLGSPDCEKALSTLVARLGESLEIIRTERLSPLSVSDSLKDMSKVGPGDAVVAFSRKTVLEIADGLKQRGRKVSVIYGALSPEVRKEEARRFREGETDIVVATDAIGLGLNLPIKTIVFYETRKWDGNSEGDAPPSLLRQIAGRAGRFGMHEEGVVTAMSYPSLEKVSHALAAKPVNCHEKFGFSASWRVVSLLSRTLNTDKLSPIMDFFLTNFVSFGKGFFPTSGQDRQELAYTVDSIRGLTIRDRFVLSLSPVPKIREEFDSCFREFAMSLASRHPVMPSEIRALSKSDESLEELEMNVKRLSLYCWLHYRFEEVFPGLEEARSAIASYERDIVSLLRRGSKGGRRTEESTVTKKKGKKRSRGD